MTAPLSGLRVLDLSRILAGPTCTQLLSDLGAEVIKIERPGSGDDTRGWGPPFKQDRDGREGESAYFLSANRGKKSVEVDLAHPAGQRLIRDLAGVSDIVVENFKAADLARRGLDYATLSALNPRLIWCSITGFGQTGPDAERPGYDFLVQGRGGIMSLTGDAEGPPMKVGVGIADVMCGMYATTALLAALHARTASGRGQHIDLALFDCQVAWLINQGVGYLTDGVVPPRRGNDHPTIVPYGTFAAEDVPFIVAVGNDAQFARLCRVAGLEALSVDPRFARNADRVRNRDALIPLIAQAIGMRPAAEWLRALAEAGVPCGPVNDLAAVFDDPQTVAREMRIRLDHRDGPVDLIGNPIKFSETPVRYASAPPTLGEHTRSVLADVLGLDGPAIADLVRSGAIGTAG